MSSASRKPRNLNTIFVICELRNLRSNKKKLILKNNNNSDEYLGSKSELGCYHSFCILCLSLILAVINLTCYYTNKNYVSKKEKKKAFCHSL